MSSEIPPSAPAPFSAAPVGSYEFLMQAVEAHGGNLPPGFASAIMGLFFMMPPIFPGFGARAFQPMPQINVIQKRIERALIKAEGETIPKELNQAGKNPGAANALALTGAKVPTAKADSFPLFRMLAREFAFAQENFSPHGKTDVPKEMAKEPAQARSEPVRRDAAQTIKITGLLEQTRLATHFLQSKESPLEGSRSLQQLESFRGKLEQFIQKLEIDFPNQKEIIQKFKGALEHFDKALDLVHALKEGRPHEMQTGKADIQREAQKALHDFIRELREPLAKGLDDKSARKVPDPMRHAGELLRSSVEKPAANTFAQMKFLAAGDAQNSPDKAVAQKMAIFLASQEAAFVKPQNTPQPPQSVVVPYQGISLNETRRLQRTKKKEDKAGKREERPLSYSSDDEEEEEENNK